MNSEEYNRLPAFFTDLVMKHFDEHNSIERTAKVYCLSEKDVKAILLYKMKEWIDIEKIRREREFTFEF